MIATNATMTANTSKMAFTSSPIQAKSMVLGIKTPVPDDSPMRRRQKIA